MKHVIDQSTLFEELDKRGINNFYHANSVETSISFFRVGALLSRNECANQKLPMSSQYTDKHDETHKIWDDIFMNFHDFHRTFKRPNKYGPILFVVNVNRLKEELLIRPDLKLHITKTQPHAWTSETSDDEKWQKDTSEVFKNKIGFGNPTFLNGWHDIVITQSSPSGIPLSVCDSVNIDNHPNNNNFYQQVSSAFQNCMNSHNLQLNLSERECIVPECTCKNWQTIVSAKNEYKYSSGNWTNDYGKIA